MKSLILVALALQGASAFPAVLNDLVGRAANAAGQSGCTTSAKCNQNIAVSNSQINYNPNSLTAAQKAQAAIPNCGVLCPCTTFSKTEQYVSNTGAHAYASPAATQIRGPCPGLNAAANHGYLPRSGVAHIVDTIAGLGALYGMSTDLAGVLAAYSVAIDGDPLTLSWSIGGPQGALLSNPQGISWSHNKYEGDTSIGRCDAYINGGDAHSLSVTRFGYAYAEGASNDRYTMDTMDRAFTRNTIRSVGQNPYYFAPLFSTTLVAPAAYHFVVAMMSNHTSSQVSGYLNGAMFKQWFGVTGSPGSFVWKPGQESIPNNWYRRPSSQPYTASGGVFGDLLTEFAAYPQSFRFGGNVNGVNTYTGIDLSSFSNGVYNSGNIFKGNNLACFAYQNIQQGLPDVLTTNPFTTAGATLLNKYLGALIGGATCPQVSKFNNNNLPPYQGRSYSPSAPAGNRQNC